MQPTKQQGILIFLTKTNFSFQERTTVKADIKQVSVLQIYNNLQKVYVQCADMLTVAG